MKRSPPSAFCTKGSLGGSRDTRERQPRLVNALFISYPSLYTDGWTDARRASLGISRAMHNARRMRRQRRCAAGVRGTWATGRGDGGRAAGQGGGGRRDGWTPGRLAGEGGGRDAGGARDGGDPGPLGGGGGGRDAGGARDGGDPGPLGRGSGRISRVRSR